MVNRKKGDRLSPEMSIYFQYLHQEGGQSINSILMNYGVRCGVSRATVHRHATRLLPTVNVLKAKSNAGRKKCLSSRDLRLVMRTFHRLRSTNANFTSKKIQLECGFANRCSNRTVRRAINEHDYFYLQPRKKGLLTATDLKKRVKFAKDIVAANQNNVEFWTQTIGFFFDGSSFVHKTHPQDQATAPRGRIWRKKGEGLAPGCTAKGSKAGYNGRVADFFVAICLGKGVVSCIQYTDKLTGDMFAKFIHDNFPNIFAKCNNPASKVFLQDGDPRQNSVAAKKALTKCGYECQSIPARSPDVNPIENVFHLVDDALREEALVEQITSETYEQFSRRVQQCMLNFPSEVIDRIILSMPKRIKMVITNKGHRLKY